VRRRQLNFEFAENPRNEITPAGALKNPGGYPPSRHPRNAKKTAAISNGCRADFAGRGSINNDLWRSIINLEVIEPHRWTEVVSADGVRGFVAILQPSALRGKS
jgi:hypothetical protein